MHRITDSTRTTNGVYPGYLIAKWTLLKTANSEVFVSCITCRPWGHLVLKGKALSSIKAEAWAHSWWASDKFWFLENLYQSALILSPCPVCDKANNRRHPVPWAGCRPQRTKWATPQNMIAMMLLTVFKPGSVRNGSIHCVSVEKCLSEFDCAPCRRVCVVPASAPVMSMRRWHCIVQ